MTPYEAQRAVFQEAKRLGWTGHEPSVLGGYAADKELAAARLFIAARLLGELGKEEA